MKQFVLTLTNGTELYDVVFDIHDNNTAKRWSDEVAKNYPLDETDRFQCWPNDGKDLTYYTTELTKQISIINSEFPNLITHNIVIGQRLVQDDMNYLHKFFENMRGEYVVGTELYHNASISSQIAMSRFNVLIHEYEDLLWQLDNPPEHYHSSIVGTYKDRPRYPLQDEDYELFTAQWKFGEVYINYCEVGKTILDVFKDGDNIVGDENVRPQSYYSADFFIKFGRDITDSEYSVGTEQFMSWLDGQDYNRDRLSIGMIPVASLNRTQFNNMDNNEIILLLSNYLKIHSTCLK